MNILVVCQHYWPEPFRLSDVCEGLVERGHKVTVVTDVPNYPEGFIYPEYRKGNRVQEKNGVKIYRTFTIGRRSSTLFRFLNYYSFSHSSRFFVKRKLKDEYDVVLCYQTSPVMMSSAGLAYAKKHGKKALLYCLDLWPTSLRVGGVSPESLLYKYYFLVSKRYYNRADKLAVSSEGFGDYMEENFGIPKSETVYIPQYADNCFELEPTEKKDTLDLVFAGNIGKAQSVETLVKAAEILKDRKNIVWHVAGEGSSLGDMKELAAECGLENIVFHGYKKNDELKAIYENADAMIMTLTADPVISLTLPLKVMSYMGSGRPIIAAVDGAAAKEIERSGCGIVVSPENPVELADAVLRFEMADNRRGLCQMAKAYYNRHFSREIFMDAIEKELEALCDKNR